MQPAASTSGSGSKDWMFCPLSGYMLELDPARGVAHCPMTGYQKSLAELSSVRIESRTNMAVSARCCRWMAVMLALWRCCGVGRRR